MSDAQRVVDTGLYAHIRHLGYAGTLTMLLGYAMAWQAPAAVLPALPMLPIYIRRITAEERLLVADLVPRRPTFALSMSAGGGLCP